MQGVPTFLQSDSVTICRTKNGYALVGEPNAPASQSLSFESLTALTAYLAENFTKQVV